jgi:CheY-like chemotaxis protein
MTLPPLIMVVDDNQITLKVVRMALEAENYRVMTAASGKECLEKVSLSPPQLILLDFRLPDIHGKELAAQLKKLPNLVNIPLIAFTGFFSHFELQTELFDIFNGYIVKPVIPSQLVEIIKGFLKPPNLLNNRPGQGHSIIIADDDQVQLKLTRIHFEGLGFKVLTARDGQEVLDIAQLALKQSRPSLIISDVLMPKMDGFKLCLAIKQIPELASIPIILTTNHFIEKSDLDFAKDLGASDLVVRSSSMDVLIRSVLLHLAQKDANHLTDQTQNLNSTYQEKMARQLERQTAMNISLGRQCSTQAAALTIFDGIADRIAENLSIESALPQILAQCIDGAGISVGILYLLEKDQTLKLQTHIGLNGQAHLSAQSFFDHPEIFLKILNNGLAVNLGEQQEDFAKLLGDHCQCKFGVLIPIFSQSEKLGILVMASQSDILTPIEWMAFAKPLGIQLGQAIALGRALTQIKSSETRYRTLMENANDGQFVIDPNGTILEVNQRAIELMKCSKQELV